jgi:hypothetical protein
MQPVSKINISPAGRPEHNFSPWGLAVVTVAGSIRLVVGFSLDYPADYFLAVNIPDQLAAQQPRRYQPSRSRQEIKLIGHKHILLCKCII